MEDLVQFVKDLSPCLSKVSHDIDARSRDLLNPYQRDALQHHLEQVKTLAPILICSMKIFIQILGHQDGKGIDEAVENRNYLAKRMTEEITEITRALEECKECSFIIGKPLGCPITFSNQDDVDFCNPSFMIETELRTLLTDLTLSSVKHLCFFITICLWWDGTSRWWVDSRVVHGLLL